MAEFVERRTLRSSFRGSAADLYLEALSRRCGLRAAVLADEHGLPVAAAGPRFVHEPLSAFGAHRAGAAPVTRGASEQGPRSTPLRLGQWQCSLTVLGPGELPWDAVEADLRRILELGVGVSPGSLSL